MYIIDADHLPSHCVVYDNDVYYNLLCYNLMIDIILYKCCKIHFGFH